MAIRQITSANIVDNSSLKVGEVDREREKKVTKSITLQKYLIQKIEDFKFEHRKSSDSQIIQEALKEYFAKYDK